MLFKKSEKSIEEKLFETIYNDYNRMMYMAAMNILNNHQLAEDALQSAFLRISMNFQRISSFPSSKIKNYCMIVIKNSAKDILKKETRFNIDREADYTEIADIEDNDTITDYNVLKEIIASLSENEQEILYLRCIMNLSFSEIATTLDIKENTARQRMHQARSNLLKKNKGDK